MLLRKNDANRCSNGWEWWGRDTCFEGNEYGETDDYYFPDVKIELMRSLEYVKMKKGNFEITAYLQNDAIVTYSGMRFKRSMFQ